MEFSVSTARLRPVRQGFLRAHYHAEVQSVHFPGAVNSKFTTKLAFARPSTHSAIPTYRVMDSNGVIVDKAREPANVSDEEILQWYENMVTGAYY